jgi:acyl dehydratase
MSETDDTGLDLAKGTVDQARQWIGRSGSTNFAHERVTRGMIRFYASMVQDDNPAYWDQRYADRRWGGLRCPPGLLMAFQLELPWTPPDVPELGVGLTADVPLPAEFDTVINVGTETTFREPIVEGDWLNVIETILDVSDEKETELGRGHFVTSKATFRRQDGTVVAENENVLFRHAPHEEESDDEFEQSPLSVGRSVASKEDIQRFTHRDRYESLETSSIGEDNSIPAIEFPVSYQTVIHNVAATRDFYPGHHNPAFARSQGTETIYLNTMAFQGLVLLAVAIFVAYRLTEGS